MSDAKKDKQNTAKKSTSTPVQPVAPAIFSNRPPTRQTEALRKQQNKFMENFNPETSTRERRKLHRKLTSTAKTAYDDRGIHIASQADLCDCLQKDCPGCHFPCPKCSSQKCGNDCRVNRKFIYEQIEYCGTDYVVKFPY